MLHYATSPSKCAVKEEQRRRDVHSVVSEAAGVPVAHSTFRRDLRGAKRVLWEQVSVGVQPARHCTRF